MYTQLAAVAIFCLMFVLLITDTLERHVVTLSCGLLTLLLVLRTPHAIWNCLNLSSLIRSDFWLVCTRGELVGGINWETIVFIAGMMIMVEGMATNGFFRWLCMELARLVHYRTGPIFVLFVLLSAVLSMFIDSITVIMFLAAVTAELARVLKVDPGPMILSEIFCANLGGAATMCGDPPNIIIGASLHYAFADFLTNTGVIVLVSLVVILPYFYLYFRSSCQENACDPVSSRCACASIKNRANSRKLLQSSLVFLCAVALLATHEYTGLTIAAIGALLGAVTLLLAGGKRKRILAHVDTKTLLFFMGLFVTVSGLEYSGVLELLAQAIMAASGGNLRVMVLIIIWGSAVASAFVDNIPFAAAMLPVIKSLSATQGVDLSVLAWSLSMGTDIGGSATPIGASANVVGVAIAARHGRPIGWGEYCAVHLPATVVVLSISTFIIFARYC